MNKIYERFGQFLIIVGVAGFIAASILSFTAYAGFDKGALPAAAFFFVVIGLVFCFPTLLQEADGGVSTMRVIVLTVVMVFAIIHVKIGWTAGSFTDFKIDNTWIYILGLAFGSKAFQKFAEEGGGKGKKKEGAEAGGGDGGGATP